MSRLVAVAPVLPPHAHEQAEITAMLGPLVTPTPGRRALLERVHAASGVRTRHLALPLADYATLTSFDVTNDRFLEIGADLAADAVKAALASAGLEPADVDLLLLTSVTGVGAPSVDATLVERLGLRPDVRRLPSFGLGCAGGAAGLARVDDFLRGRTAGVAVLVCVELCSLTLQHDDDSSGALVASALFGDGGAAAVLVGDAHPARSAWPELVGSRAHLVPGTADQLGWHVGATGFRIVLSPGLPDVLATHLSGVVDALLAEHGLERGDVGTWVVHAGGPKVLDAVEEALHLSPDALHASRSSLATVGNLSSASVLHVLHLTQAVGPPAPGTLGVLMAFGPGVSCDLVLLRWPGEA